MAELLPDRLGVNAVPPLEGDKDEKPKRRQISNILEWIQCFSIYMAVRAQQSPAKIQDMLGYQTLIVEARMEYEGDGWLGYDRCFRQNAAASSDICWSKIDPTLWNKAFAGQAKASRCKHCFSLTHSAEECDWAPTPSANKAPVTNKYVSAPRARPAKVCYEWNHNPSPACPFPGCSTFAGIAAQTRRSPTRNTRPCTAHAPQCKATKFSRQATSRAISSSAPTNGLTL